MTKESMVLKSANVGDVCFGFELVKKEFIKSKNADLYTLVHQKTKAELLYFDRADENKTFSISFKTLPEDSTGVFHILEHSVLNGSTKYPVKEPFVSMLQSSMQTFLNAFTFSDKTMFPVSSRNEQDLFNLMSVYLDAVFNPIIYKRPEIFMQEGWHYEFDSENAEPYYNGVVFSEMKGVYADVDRLIEDETSRLVFPDNCYGFVSGGHPENIPDLTYEQFIATHKRFYHPTNSKIILDGQMNIDSVLKFINDEYLSKYDYRAPDFDFVEQSPKSIEKTVYYEARRGEEELAHLSIAKILCKHDEVEKTYAAKVLADYLTGSNEAPLKRAFLEQGLGQDINLDISDGIYQPMIALVVHNTSKDNFDKIKEFLPNTAKDILKNGLDKSALLASLERFAFTNKEINEPYGVELAVRALSGWLYGDDPMTHIDNGKVFDSLRAKVEGDYFEKLLGELLCDKSDKSYLYVLPSLNKGAEDAKKEAERISKITATWSDEKKHEAYSDFVKMQQWQQSADSEEVLSTLPHLDIKDISREVSPIKTEAVKANGVDILKIDTDTNGIVYLNLYFDISDFSVDELRTLNVMTACFGELRTENYSASAIQNMIKATLGGLGAKIELIAKSGDIENCKPYLLVSASMLKENVEKAVELIKEILLNGKYDEANRINETVLQNDYMLKQSIIGSGHVFAITKSLSAFSKYGAMKELLDGESFVNWFSDYAADFKKNHDENCEKIANLTSKAFAKNRLFVGASIDDVSEIEKMIEALPVNEIGEAALIEKFDKNDCSIEIPADVGFSALGCNLYAIGDKFKGSCSVAASLMTFGFLWNAVRVQGGAYGTGMSIRANGDMFCYSYRDPNLENSKEAFCQTADFLEDFLSRNMPLDDIIIGTVNTTEPLLDPSGICDLACARFLKGTKPDSIAKIRGEILDSTNDDLKNLVGVLRKYIENGKLCAVGNPDAVAFADTVAFAGKK